MYRPNFLMETFMKLIALVSGLFFVTGNAMAAVKTCQTADEINAHVETTAPEEFCFHKVVDPAIGLYHGMAIPSFYQLMPNLEVAFLNTKKNFDEAQTSCDGLGAGWHAPASSSSDPGATPRANDNSNSLEGVGSYFKGTVRQDFWSSSSFSYNTYGAWYVGLSAGITYYNDKYDSYNVVCVRP
jgi:hypothetical protein